MANKVVLELEAAEKVVVADLRIALLLAQSKVNDIKQKAEAEYKAATDEALARGNALMSQLKTFAVAAKVDAADLQFDFEKYFFFVKTTVTEKVEDAVKAVDATITAAIKGGEAAVVKEVAAVEAGAKAVFSETEQKVIAAVDEVKKAL